jgi:hypothetical protein
MKRPVPGTPPTRTCRQLCNTAVVTGTHTICGLEEILSTFGIGTEGNPWFQQRGCVVRRCNAVTRSQSRKHIWGVRLCFEVKAAFVGWRFQLRVSFLWELHLDILTNSNTLQGGNQAQQRATRHSRKKTALALRQRCLVGPPWEADYKSQTATRGNSHRNPHKERQTDRQL